jgi:hypothetical protein
MASTVYDTSGNNNGYLNSGETADITVALKHLGGTDFTNLSTTLESSDSYITISDNSGYFGFLGVDSVKENINDPYVVSVSTSAPQGHIASCNLIASDAGFGDTLEVKLALNPYDYLVWNPDPTPSSGETIDNILSSLGYSGVYSTTITDLDLMAYRTMFVCLGVYPQKYVVSKTSEEAGLVVDFLDGGYPVYLEGGDVWFYDPEYYNGYDFGPLFGIDGLSDGSNDMGPVVGVSGTFTQGMNFTYSGENLYMDHITATGTGFVVFQDGDNSYDCGVANDPGTYKTVGGSFELGGLDDGSGVSTKAVLLDSIMHVFGIFPTGVEEFTESDVIMPQLTVAPNPFSHSIQIRYEIPEAVDSRQKSVVSMRIYDATGRLVKDFRLTPDALRPTHISWDGTDNRCIRLPAGIYFVHVESENHRLVQKVILMK